MTGPAYSISTLGLSAYPNGNYTLNATFVGSADTAPTGNVVFTDITTGTAIGTATLSPTAAQFVIGPPLVTQAGPIGVSADINNDGISDIVTATVSGIMVFLGHGDGTFQPPITTNANLAAGFGALQLADLNEDGNLDLIANSANGTVLTLLGNGEIATRR